MNNIQVLVVYDEPLARERLKNLLGTMEGFDYAGQASGGLQAIDMASADTVDVVLLDIRMPGMSGLEVGRHLSMLDHAPAIIFTTAYSEHALEAFQSHAVDYLLKPIRPEKLLAALTAASKLTRAQAQQLGAELDSGRRSHVCARVRGDLRLIQVNDIFFFKADSKYVEVHHKEGVVLIEESLLSLEEEFGSMFIRVHRNALVATACIDGLQKDGQGRSYLTIDQVDEKVEVSRRHLPGVRALLKG